MATAKKTAPKGKKQANAAEVDELLGGKKAKGGDDLLEGKGGKKATAKKAAGKSAPAAKKASGGSGSTEAIRAVLSKTKKLTSYQDIADANGFDIRAVRRTSRAMDEEGVLERVKEGTVVFVKAKSGK